MLDRRTLLRASGVSLALPLLESMTTSSALATTPAPMPSDANAQTPPRRGVFMCTTLGLHPPNLFPDAPVKDYKSTKYLELLQEHRDNFTLFSGLQHEDQTGRQPHDSEMTWLTAARKPGMGGFRNTISVDQLAAKHIGDATRLRSLSLGTIKAQSQSYTDGGVMIPAHTSPAKMFAQLFLDGKPHEIKAQKQKLDDGKSILDELRSQTKALQRKASTSDNHLLDDYFESLRVAESNIASAQLWMEKPKPKVESEPPKDIFDSADIIGRAQLLIDLVPLILQTDSTRVVSIMVQDHFSVPKVEGVTGNHHNLSHHGQDPTKIKQLEKIETAIIECFSSLLGQLKSKQEAGQTLLDNTSVLFGSNLGNANAHHAKNLPIMLAGGGYEHAGYVAKQEGTPLCNLFVTLLQGLSVEVDTFGQSNGTLSW
ncbi:MAG: DUF1552 domain-containing protein [Planctomycetota bacterium]